jgi:hypothetical protein
MASPAFPRVKRKRPDFSIRVTTPLASTCNRLSVSVATRNKSEKESYQFGGKSDISRLTLSSGKMAVPDFCENNAYAHDTRTGFMNRSILNQKTWAFRAA